MSLDQSRQEIPTAPDYDEIVAFIQANYIDSVNNGDVAALRRFFHEDASYYFVEQDGVAEQHGPCDDALVRSWTVDYPDGTSDWEWTVIWVRQAGDLASVMLEMHSRAEPDQRWVDLHALLRIDGEWHDMNKTAVHADLADWAGR